MGTFAVLALSWGILWALFLQFTDAGRWLAVRRTWVTVVIGVGVDLLILLMVLSLEAWVFVAGVLTLSSIGVIVRSIWNEYHEDTHE